MSDRDAMWIKMVQDVGEDRDRQARRADEIVWAILAGGDGHQIFGKPIRVTVEWPEGLPTGMGFKTPDDVRALAVERLARLRGQIADHPGIQPDRACHPGSSVQPEKQA